MCHNVIVCKRHNERSRPGTVSYSAVVIGSWQGRLAVYIVAATLLICGQTWNLCVLAALRSVTVT